MDKSSVTMTADDDWWLERVTMEGEQRYPKRIRVGSLEDPRVYVPERTAEVDLTEVIYKARDVKCWECSSCGRSFESLFGDYEYCPRCGARLVRK